MSKFKVGDKVRYHGEIWEVYHTAGAYMAIANSSAGYLRTSEKIHEDKVTPVDSTLPLNCVLPQDSKIRKDYPLYRGLLKYFPAALALVAKISKIGNDKHNPGKEMHHARGKSGDHEDCILRHLIDLHADYGKGVGRDEQGIPQVGYIAWRALALAQIWLEKNDGAPLAPGAKE